MLYSGLVEAMLAQSPKPKSSRKPPAVPAKPARLESAERYFSRAVGNALTVLETLQGSSVPLGLREVTALTKLPKSSVFRILRTLEIAGYAVRMEGDRFRLGEKGPGFFPAKLAAAITNAATVPMRQLGREFR